MAQKLEKVKAGDLITASFMNTLLTQLEDLEDRVAALETNVSTPSLVVKITGFEFNKSPLRVGDRLRVKGQNFSVPAELNEVFIGGVKVLSFALDSGDTQLSFDVPTIPGLAGAGSNVTVKVTNPNGTDSDVVTVAPKLIIPDGTIQVTYVTPPVMPLGTPNIESSKSYIFTLEVKATADQQGNYTLTPSVIGVQNWTAELLEDNGDTVRSSNVITLPGNPITGATKHIRVRVKVPSAQANGTAGTVRLAVNENTPDTGVVPGNAQFVVTVGQPPPTPETRVRIMLESAFDSARITLGKVMLKRGQGMGMVGFSLQFAVGGNFQVTTAVKNPTGWTVGDIDSPSFTLANPPQGTTANKTVLAQFAAGASAAETEILINVTGTPTTGPAVNIKYAVTAGAD
ncbi:MAG TPA: IPT/TIG domain-containing protein [Pyrinomonadaceae bacterium]|jgi:hypothetical protein